MATGTGYECINLKKAKYNRDMRAAKAEAFAAVPESKKVYNAEVSPASRASAVRSSDIPRDDGITVKDVLDAVGDELLKAIAARRRKKARERANDTKYITRDVKAAKSFPVSVIGYIVVFSVIAMFLVLGNSRINEATLYADTLKSQISAEKNKGEILTSELNSRYDVREIEEYAISEMGLVKMTDVSRTYIDISGEDMVVVKSGIDTVEKVKADVTMTLNSGY